MAGNANEYPVYGDHVYEQPIGYPTGELLVLNGGSNTIYSRIIPYETFCLNASEYMVSLDANFSGASWQTLTRTGSITASSDGAVTVYCKYRNPGYSESAVVAEVITIDTDTTERWDIIMNQIGSKVKSLFPTYKVLSTDPNIQRYVLGPPAEAYISERLPILFVDMDGLAFSFTDGNHLCGTREQFAISLHIVTLDDVNEQNKDAKYKEFWRTVQGVARVLYHKRSLEGVVHRIIARSMEKTGYSTGEGRSVLSGRISADVLWTANTI